MQRFAGPSESFLPRSGFTHYAEGVKNLTNAGVQPRRIPFSGQLRFRSFPASPPLSLRVMSLQLCSTTSYPPGASGEKGEIAGERERTAARETLCTRLTLPPPPNPFSLERDRNYTGHPLPPSVGKLATGRNTDAPQSREGIPLRRHPDPRFRT